MVAYHALTVNACTFIPYRYYKIHLESELDVIDLIISILSFFSSSFIHIFPFGFPFESREKMITCEFQQFMVYLNDA